MITWKQLPAARDKFIRSLDHDWAWVASETGPGLPDRKFKTTFTSPQVKEITGEPHWPVLLQEAARSAPLTHVDIAVLPRLLDIPSDWHETFTGPPTPSGFVLYAEPTQQEAGQIDAQTDKGVDYTLPCHDIGFLWNTFSSPSVLDDDGQPRKVLMWATLKDMDAARSWAAKQHLSGDPDVDFGGVRLACLMAKQIVQEPGWWPAVGKDLRAETSFPGMNEYTHQSIYNLHMVWWLMSQTIVSVVPGIFTKQERRAAAKARRNPPAVRRVVLRRERKVVAPVPESAMVAAPAVPSEIEPDVVAGGGWTLTYGVEVRGFWRYHSRPGFLGLDQHGVRCEPGRTWIHAHHRGPNDDGPAPKRVYDLVR